MKGTSVVLNKNINQFDKMEERIGKKTHSYKEWIKRIVKHYEDKWFEPTYKEEYEKQNLQIDKMSKRITTLQRNNTKLLKKIKRLEKRLKNYEKENS